MTLGLPYTKWVVSGGAPVSAQVGHFHQAKLTLLTHLRALALWRHHPQLAGTHTPTKIRTQACVYSWDQPMLVLRLCVGSPDHRGHTTDTDAKKGHPEHHNDLFTFMYRTFGAPVSG